MWQPQRNACCDSHGTWDFEKTNKIDKSLAIQPKGKEEY